MTRKSAIEISVDTVDVFCKNVFNLRAVSTRTFQEERTVPASEVLCACMDDLFDDPPQVCTCPDMHEKWVLNVIFQSSVHPGLASNKYCTAYVVSDFPMWCSICCVFVCLLTTYLLQLYGYQTPIFWYLALRAVDRFQEIHHRLPGVEDETVTPLLYAELQNMNRTYEAC